MTDTLVMLDHRDAGILGNNPDQPLAAARDDEVYIVLQFKHLIYCLPLDRREYCHCISRHPYPLQGLMDNLQDGYAGMKRLGTSTQNNGIAILKVIHKAL